jgi:hypothetical protein
MANRFPLALERCDFIKIDVDGMELDVLKEVIHRFEHLLASDYQLYWHLPWLYNSDNFFADPENIFPRIVSYNMVAVPRTGPLSITVHGLIEIASPDASPPGGSWG